ncbi:hypothetical protein [Haloarcula argentinensis]|uniref:Uncharacterized protein n=1 Tax=Haloarcula argentinensis TaxID=43776 RepID=A0A830FWY8_HALAR|nr:hypothetical protein [Haloarcula argentinensis]EMA18763.1 hypothetical protein C443_19744 [Haloarcula argentinensis DSM 12282]MDS0253676.1 hypothetical protein [Haloarcula argentinensis]GGM47621.1 hypothetical protein GCM10009006_31050 [Haloarcula argentinensis]
MVANERGQLLLVGGIAVAIVVFSTILFAHSLAVTDGITTTGSAETIERSADREASVERDLGRLAAETRGDDIDGFEERYEYALRNYTKTHNRVVASSGGTYLNATLNESASLGTEVNQTNSKQFKRPHGTGSKTDWDIAQDVRRVAVFRATVTNINGKGNRLNITVNSSKSKSVDWYLNVTGDPSGNRRNATVNGNLICDGKGELHINLVEGTCEIGGSTKTSFTSFSDTVDSRYNVSINHGSHASGTYVFAADGDFTSPDSYNSADTSPYPVVPAVDTTYHTPSASYNRTVLVEVDDG